MLIIVSNVVVDLLMKSFTGIILDVLTNIDVDVLLGVMSAFEFVIPGRCEDFRCWAAFDCRPMAGLDCDDVL